MEWLNYHHLLYFWLVAREGGVAQASARLHLAPPTLSGQIRALENALGEKLFAKQGRKLVLTEMGRVVYGYADEIFTLGRELMDTIKGRPTGRPVRLTVGIADVVPKLIARRLLEPARHFKEPVRLVCREDKPDQLLAELALHNLDVVIADSPVGPSSAVRAFNHLLFECGISFFGTSNLADAHRSGFPRSLDGAPILLPTANSNLRRLLDQWFSDQQIRPAIAGEFEDSALLKVFGQDGLGLFPVPSAIEEDVGRQYSVKLVGRTDKIRERFWAVSVERKLRHPAVVAICDAARHTER